MHTKTDWRPIITIWGLSLCFLVGLVVGLPMVSPPGDSLEAVTGQLADTHRVAAVPGLSPSYGNASATYGNATLAVERFDREIAAGSEACQQPTENLTATRERQRARIERIRARTTKVQSEAFERIEAALARTDS